MKRTSIFLILPLRIINSISKQFSILKFLQISAISENIRLSTESPGKNADAQENPVRT